ncbi:unnamed protein product [Macrosiphum euphorbiae]|uniref:Uncharacterized protein n=1 Tax=Macrosiphum euphorbiae TaxID=13131 RepID=A0AAV0WN39_9HEMI|nr:unnamed protein product [Macrosiphum euphorbiae]
MSTGVVGRRFGANRSGRPVKWFSPNCRGQQLCKSKIPMLHFAGQYDKNDARSRRAHDGDAVRYIDVRFTAPRHPSCRRSRF